MRSFFPKINIRKFLDTTKDSSMLNETLLDNLLSTFSCSVNKDVEHFLKRNAKEFTRKNQSVTYLVMSPDGMNLLGYFSIAIKPITVDSEQFSNTMKKKLARVSEFDKENSKYTLSAYLIAQLGKNYSLPEEERIKGIDLMQIAEDTIRDIQYMTGGMVTFLEAENKTELMELYVDKCGYKKFAVRETAETKEHQSHKLIQLLKIL